jgi:hypothetical protein
MGLNRGLFQKGVISGLRKAWSGYLWILKILIPISLLTSALEWTGIIYYLDIILRPIMGFLSLPATAAFPLLMGMLTGIYGGIAAMTALPFTVDQMTLIAIFMTMCHGLIQEGFIQGKTGLHFIPATLFRLVTATLTVLAVAPFLQSSPEISALAGVSVRSMPSIITMLEAWGVAVFHLMWKILIIIMVILVLLELLKVMGWIRYVAWVFSPILKMLGLSQRVAFLWIAGAVFGLSYSAAIIMEEVKDGHLTKQELQQLHLSIGIQHSIIEDPILFMVLGLNPFWLWFPRFIMAMGTVRGYTFWQEYTKKRRKAQG